MDRIVLGCLSAVEQGSLGSLPAKMMYESPILSGSPAAALRARAESALPPEVRGFGRSRGWCRNAMGFPSLGPAGPNREGPSSGGRNRPKPKSTRETMNLAAPFPACFRRCRRPWALSPPCAGRLRPAHPWKGRRFRGRGVSSPSWQDTRGWIARPPLDRAISRDQAGE
jgi:hypothetical protein